MKEKTLYPLWGGLYILCVFFGVVSERSALGAALLMVLSLVFFIPGVWLLAGAYRRSDRKALRRIRLICLCSLGLTALLLVLNIAVAPAGSTSVRELMEVLLHLVSAPMLCSGHWALSLFLWGCLLMGTFPRVLGKKC